jgi:hypothetical protein
MAKRKKKEHDFAVTAFRVVQEATGQESGIDYAVIGRKGGLKGGKARAQKLTPEERSTIAQKAAIARWGKGEERSQ